MEQYWVWLSSVEGIGPKHFARLLASFGDARAVWDAVGDNEPLPLGPKTLANLREARTSSYFHRLFDQLEQVGAQPVTRISEGYSDLLSEICDPPPTLYVLGESDLRFDKPFAIVGTRSPTRDGTRSAGEFAERLARSGATVISGMARGIDAKAHEGCLKGGGRTVAVLGCGVDVIYPPEHADLRRRILESGGAIVSEYLPGTTPAPQNFPPRNRIISGLSAGVLLVEGSRKSGGMITADYAAEQGRDLFVIPGSIYSSAAEAPNALLMQGAFPVISPWDIPEHYKWAERPSQSAREEKKPTLTPEEEAIVAPLRSESKTFGELEAETGLSASKLNSVLTMLELRGIIWKAPGGAYRAGR